MVDLKVIEEFLNTVDHRTFSRHGRHHVGAEHLDTPQALADWLAAHDLARSGDELGPADLAAATALRTTLRRALTDDDPSDPAPVLAGHALELAPDGAVGLRVVSRSGRPWLDPIVETVAASVSRGDWQRIKLCAAPDCRWAFYDTSRSGRGRWCDMEVCGNRHKTRTYRRRRQAE